MNEHDHHHHESTPEPAPEGPRKVRVRFPLTRIAMGAVGMVVALWLLVTELRSVEIAPEDVGGHIGRHVVVREPGPLVEIESKSGAERVYLAPESGLVITTAPEAPKPEGPVAGRAAKSESATVLDASRGRWTAKAVFAIFLALWGAGIVGSSLYLWRTLGRTPPAAA